jgi:Lar family restriction alleviation protein
MKKTELKPCPFCGSTKIQKDYFGGYDGAPKINFLLCKDCNANTIFEGTGRNAVKKWNTRAAEESVSPCDKGV